MNGFAQNPVFRRFLIESNLGAGYQHNVELIHFVIELLKDPRRVLDTTNKETLEAIADEFGLNINELIETDEFIDKWKSEFDVFKYIEQQTDEEALEQSYVTTLRYFLERIFNETFQLISDENLEHAHSITGSFDFIDSKAKISAEAFENTLLRLESLLKLPRGVVNIPLRKQTNSNEDKSTQILYPAVREQFCFFGSILIDIDYFQDAFGHLKLNHAQAYLNWTPSGWLGEELKEAFGINESVTPQENGVYALSLDVTNLCFTKLTLLLKLGHVSDSWTVEPVWNLLSTKELREIGNGDDDDKFRKQSRNKLLQLPPEFLSNIKYDSLMSRGD